MLICQLCGKRSRKLAISKHKKGASGASKWPLRAPITKRIQRPNLHTYQGVRFCTKCLRTVKANLIKTRQVSKKLEVVESPQAAS